MTHLASTKTPPLQRELSELEAQFSSGHSDRGWTHRRLDELKAAMGAEANPVLRAEYLRRLALLDGSESPSRLIE